MGRFYFAEGTAKDTAIDEFKTAFPANILMITGWQYKELILLIAKKAS